MDPLPELRTLARSKLEGSFRETLRRQDRQTSREARSRKRSIQAEEGTAYAKAQGWLLTTDTAFSCLWS